MHIEMNHRPHSRTGGHLDLVQGIEEEGDVARLINLQR